MGAEEWRTNFQRNLLANIEIENKSWQCHYFKRQREGKGGRGGGWRERDREREDGERERGEEIRVSERQTRGAGERVGGGGEGGGGQKFPFSPSPDRAPHQCLSGDKLALNKGKEQF